MDEETTAASDDSFRAQPSFACALKRELQDKQLGRENLLMFSHKHIISWRGQPTQQQHICANTTHNWQQKVDAVVFRGCCRTMLQLRSQPPSAVY